MRLESAAILLALACATGTGCGNSNARPPMEGQTMIPAGRGRLPTEPYSPVDQPGPVPYDNARVTREVDGDAAASRVRPSADVERALERAVPSLAEPFDPASDGSRKAATQSGAASPGAFSVVGGVVAEVNSTPIFADKVISDIEPVLSARAREMDANQFRAFATKEIGEQVQENIRRELEFAAAERELDDRDKERAKHMAERWRQQATAAAGGSVETVRRQYAAHGREFDVEVHEQFRRFMSILYLQKRILPRAQVNAADMRAYYNANVEKAFTVRDAAQFEMIQVDPVKVGGREEARKRAEDYRAQAAGGRNFAELVAYSNRPPLRKSDGELPWWEKGAFALAAVEEAAWKLEPGSVSDVIEDGGKFYVIKLEQKRKGRVVPFEEEQTQKTIREELVGKRLGLLRQQQTDDLRKEAIIRTNPAMMQSALDIAMQRYPFWATK
jgi:parvulin-like peptidyl-prolyl isomerase